METETISPSGTKQNASSLGLTFGHLERLENVFYQDLKLKGKGKNTLKNYKTDLQCFNSFLLEQFSEPYLKDFNLHKVQAYASYLHKRYASDNSRRRRVQTLRIFFDFLVAQGVFSENPVRKLPSSPKFLDIPRPTPLTEVKTLWQFLLTPATKHESSLEGLIRERNQIIFLLIYGAGLKVSDLSLLKQESLLSVATDRPRVLVTPEKRDPYSVPLPSLFSAHYLSYREKLYEAQQNGQIDFNDLLFNANPYRILSGGLSPRGLELIFKDLRKKLDINLTPKSLRQSCIFKWLHQKKSETSIKEWLGVAPSYSLKPYRDAMGDHYFDDEWLDLDL